MWRFSVVLAWVAIICAHPVLAQDHAAGTGLSPSAAYQARFLRGVESMQAGEFLRAVVIFEQLEADTGSLRVKLELARALFLAHEYDRSEQAFHEVLSTPDLPWPVEEKVRVYLDEIDMATGYIKFDIGLVSDSNPRNFTTNPEVMIGGQQLTVAQPDDNREVFGVRLASHGYWPLDIAHQTSAFFSAAYSEFPGHTFDRLVANVGVMRDVPHLSWLKAKAGIEGSLLDGRTLYRFPYVAALAVMPPSAAGYHLQSEFKIGRLQVPQMPYLDANNLVLSSKLAYPPQQTLAFSNELNLEQGKTDETAYSYRGGSVGGGMVWAPSKVGLRLTFGGTVGRREYQASDPFFGERRRDTTWSASVDCLRPSWRISGYRPQIGVTYERTESTLDYYSFGKWVLRFQMGS